MELPLVAAAAAAAVTGCSPVTAPSVLQSCWQQTLHQPAQQQQKQQHQQQQKQAQLKTLVAGDCSCSRGVTTQECSMSNTLQFCLLPSLH
jgi:hypothetical protein